MTNQIQLKLFDYNQLDEGTREFVQFRTDEIRALVKRSAQDIIEIGQKLIEVKERLPHGAFGGWLESEFEWSDRTARRFMSVAEVFKSDTVSDLKFEAKALYLLAAPSTPDEAVNEALELAQNGQNITHKDAKAMIEEHKSRECEPPQKELPNGITRCLVCDNLYDCETFQSGCPYCFKETHNFNSWVGGLPEIMERTSPHVSHNSGDNEWYTPQQFIDAARKVMDGIDLDPASTETANEVVRADKIFTIEDNGLSQEWRGRIWMNPPYARDLVQKFCDKLVDHFACGDVMEAIVLVNNATETQWFQRLSKYSSALCLLEGRVKFWHPEKISTPLQGQAIIYLGKHTEQFRQEFEAFGVTWKK